MEAADDEIEALTSLWEDLKVERPSDTVRTITQKVKSFENEATSASVVLECTIVEGYPDERPVVNVSNPRGLGDAEFEQLRREIDVTIDENVGFPAISAIFQKCVDFLGENQHKNLVCLPCMCPLTERAIVVTACDHFMHSHCFCQYLKTKRDEIVDEMREKLIVARFADTVDRSVPCPMCRVALSEEGPGSDADGRETADDVKARIGRMIAEFTRFENPQKERRRQSVMSEEEDGFVLALERWREVQALLKVKMDRQLANDGIIDVDSDRIRNQFRIGPDESTEAEEILI